MPRDSQPSAAATVDRPAEPAPQEQAAPAAQTPDGAAAAGAPAPETAATPPQSGDWRSTLDAVPVEDLRSHPRFAGVVGQMVDDAMRKHRAELDRQNRERLNADTAERLRREMRAKAQADPYAFATEWLSQVEADEAKTVLDQQRRDLERQALAQQSANVATAIGTAFQEIPEWKEMTAEDFEDLAKAVGNDDDPLTVFRKYLPKIIGKVSAKRAEKAYQDRHSRDLDAEVEARVKQRLAEMRRGAPRPDLRPAANAPAAFDPSKLTDRDFDAWYKENVLDKL